MRVLLAHNRYRLRGGEERHLDLLEAGLRSAGASVLRYEKASSGVGTFRKRVELGCGVVYRPSTGRAVGELVRREHVDVVHVHNLLPGLSPSVLRAAKRSGAAVVLTAHNYRLFCPSGTLTRAGRENRDCVRGSSLACALHNPRGSWSESVAYGVALEVQRRLHLVARWSDALVAPCHYLARTLSDAGFPSERIHVLPYGVDVPAWRRRPRRYALYAGRLAPEKGLETLLAAVAAAPHIPLVVAGGGPLEGRLLSQELPNVTYAGFLSEHELAALRDDAAFVVVPSEWPDVQPLSALEALAHGKPILVSDRGGLPELVDGEYGRVFASGDPVALARAMSDLWDASTRDDDLSRSAWEAARGRFSLESRTAAILDLYRSLAVSS